MTARVVTRTAFAEGVPRPSGLSAAGQTSGPAGTCRWPAGGWACSSRPPRPASPWSLAETATGNREPGKLAPPGPQL